MGLFDGLKKMVGVVDQGEALVQDNDKVRRRVYLLPQKWQFFYHEFCRIKGDFISYLFRMYCCCFFMKWHKAFTTS